MIPVQILSRYDLEDRIQDGRRLYSHCISITDPDVPLKVDLAPAFRAVLTLRFHDIDRRSDMPKEDRPRLPMPSDARKVVEFFRATRPEATGYTVHCHAGVHRSTAVGLALLYLETGSEKAAAAELLRLKPLPMPNRRLVRLFDRLLGSRLAGETESLWNRARDYLEDRICIDPDDYLEELEEAE